MNTAEIKDILQSNYDRNNWLRFLVYVANQNNNRLKDTLHVQDLSHQFNNNSYPISTLLRIGTYYTTDRRAIPVYEVGLKNTIRIERNRVGVNQFIKNIVLKQQGSKAALCVFKYDRSDIREWRFSFISKFAASQFFSDVAAKETQPKRYTYIFGTTEEHRTAIQCFQNLKNSGFNIQDFFDAFSVEKVSKDFFNGYKDHYQTLVDEISGITANYTTVFDNNDKAVRDFSKRLLGRIVFLYFLQKKHWLGSSTLDYKDGDPDFLFTLFKESNCTEDGSDYYLHKLTELFFDTLNRKRDADNYTTPNGSVVKVPYLNGGLFDDSSEPKGYELLIIPNWVFLRLFEFLNQYNFTIDESSPEDHTVAVDPEMLGHIFENLLEDNKDKGAFYTPKEIVHYMCQESLIEYLTTHLSKSYTVYKEMGKGQVELFGNDSKTGQLSLVESIGDKALDKAEIEHMVRNKDISKLTNAQLSKMDSLLNSVKICDPAIGSGAFPMGLLQEIFAIKELIAYQTQTEWKPAEVKANIIQNSIYGVDIEQGAVDIAQLRFWLSLVVDEDLPSPLPNLDYKIVTGNSLVTKFNDEVVEIEWEIDKNTGFQTNIMGTGELMEEKLNLFQDLADKQKRYFDADAKNKEKLQKAIRLLTLQVLEKQLKLTIETKGFERQKDGKKLTKKQEARLKQTEAWKYSLQEIRVFQANNRNFSFFDWKLNFPEVLNPYLIQDESKRGFDIVIANPPYVEAKKLKHISKHLKKYDVYSGTADLSIYFFERGFDILKERGQLCFINTNKFFNTGYGKNLRKLILEKDVIQLLNFEQVEVFEGILVSSVILIANNIQSDLNEFKYKKYYKLKRNNFTKEFSKIHLDIGSYEKKFITEDEWSFADKKSILLKEEIESKGQILENTSGIQIYRGITTGFNPAFIVDEKLKNKLIADDEKAKDVIKPLLQGRNIRRWKYNKGNEYLIFLPWHFPLHEDSTISGNSIAAEKEFEKEYSSLYEHVSRFKEELSSRNQEETGVRYEWYALQRCAASYYPEFEKSEKIIWGLTADKWAYAYDNKKNYLPSNGYILTSTDIPIKYLLAVLNSNLLKFYFGFIGVMTAGGAFTLKHTTIKNLPVAIAINKAPFITLVDYILHLLYNSNEIETDLIVSYFEQIIDGMVYELYFPELLQQHNRTIIEHLGDLPTLGDDMNDEEKMEIITKVYDRLNHKEHPVRNNLFYMKNIEEIKIIEGLD